MAELWQEIQDERHERMGELAEILELKGLLKADLGLDEATDILWTLTSNDNYVHLVLERGWSGDKYEQWLAEVLANTLMLTDGR